MALKIDIKEEQRKANEEVKKQGFRVLVCSGTGCIANGALEIIKKFEELGANVSQMTELDELALTAKGL